MYWLFIIFLRGLQTVPFQQIVIVGQRLKAHDINDMIAHDIMLISCVLWIVDARNMHNDYNLSLIKRLLSSNVKIKGELYCIRLSENQSATE